MVRLANIIYHISFDGIAYAEVNARFTNVQDHAFIRSHFLGIGRWALLGWLVSERILQTQLRPGTWTRQLLLTLIPCCPALVLQAVLRLGDQVRLHYPAPGFHHGKAVCSSHFQFQSFCFIPRSSANLEFHHFRPIAGETRSSISTSTWREPSRQISRKLSE